MQACLHISIRPARHVCHPPHPRAFAARPALLPPRPALLPSAPPARLPPARRFCPPSRPAPLPSAPPGALPSARRFCHPSHPRAFAARPALLPSVPPGTFAIRPARRFAIRPALLPSAPPARVCRPPGAFATPPGAFAIRPALLATRKKRRSKACFAPAWWRRHPESNRGMRILQTLALPLGYVAGDGAGDGARTRHLSLGKAALYQMSYSRRSAATAAGLVHPQGLEPWTP